MIRRRGEEVTAALLNPCPYLIDREWEKIISFPVNIITNFNNEFNPWETRGRVTGSQSRPTSSSYRSVYSRLSLVHHFFNPFAGSSTVSAQVAPPSSSPLRSVGQLFNFRPPFRRNKPKRGKGRQGGGREEGVRGDYRCSDKDAFQELVY